MQDEKINIQAASDFLDCIKGIGKTTDLVSNVKDFIDEALMFNNEFEVCVVVSDVNQKKLYRTYFSDHYSKHIEFRTLSDVLYRLSEFPIEHEVPNIKYLIGIGKEYAKFFVEPDCYIKLCREQLDKLKQIGEIL